MVLSMALFFFIEPSHTLSAQAEKVEQLKNKLKKQEQAKNHQQDSLYILTLTKLGFAYYSYQTDSTIYYCEKAVKLAQGIQNKSLEANALNVLAIAYYVYSDYKTALDTLASAKRIFEEINHSEGLGNILNLMGAIYDFQGDVAASLEVHEQSLALRIKINDSLGIANSYHNMAMCQSRVGAYLEAINNYNLSLEILKKIKNQGDYIALTYNNIGNLNRKLRRFEQSELFFKKSLELTLKSGNYNLIGTNYVNLGLIQKEEYNNYDSALYYYQKGLDVFLKTGDRPNIASSYYNLGLIYYEKDDVENLKKSLVQLRKYYVKDNIEVFISYLMLESYYHIEIKNFDKAYEFSLKALQISNESDIINKELDLYRDLSVISEKRNDFEKAFQYLSKYNQLSDSIFKIEVEEALEKQKATFEFEQKEKELLYQQSQRELEFEQKAAKQRLYLYLIVSALIIVLLVVIFIINNYKIKEKAYHKLELANEEINKTAQRLEESNKLKDKLFTIIGHDLRNPIQTLKGYIELMQSGDLDSQDFKEASNIFAKNINNTLVLLDSLLLWAKSKIESSSMIELVSLDLCKLLNRNIELIADNASKKDIKIRVLNTPICKVWANENTVNLIIRNLLSNAVKFTPMGGEITVDVTDEKEYLWVSIHDNGIGMTQEQINSIGIHRNISKNGTLQEEGTGLGLMFCKDFILKNKGELRIESELGKGSTFSFSLKKAQ